MPYGEITAGDLRKALEGLPDDAPVLVKPNDPDEFASQLKRNERGRIIEHVPSWVKPWSYDVRLVHNVYHANDDRFDQNSVLLIELGENPGL
jgi:hypothetical protein